MNPLDWRGPAFLLFYLGWGVTLLFVARAWRRSAERGDGVRLTLSDPYLIAHLRGGRDEALRVATLSLVDRGLLEWHEGGLRHREGVTREALRRSLEKEIFAHFGDGRDLASLFEISAAGAATLELERTLRDDGLLPGETEQRARRGRLLFLLAVLLLPALAKLFVALERGRSNVFLLLAAAALFSALLAFDGFPQRTERGEALLRDLRELFSGLRERAGRLPAGGGTAEVVLLAAVFGLGAFPSGALGNLPQRLQRATAPRPEPTGCGSTSYTSCGAASGAASSAGGDSSGGSSCGAASGGSSCGGGGCGGCGGG